MRVTLDFHFETTLPVDAAGLLPLKVLSLSSKEIERLQVRIGSTSFALGDCCHIACESDATDELVLAGHTGHLDNIGSKMDGSRLTVKGDVGHCAGVEMRGGELVISGNAGDYLGVGLQNGLIRVERNAGNHCGACLPGHKEGMTGGMIFVAGDAGNEAGAAMRRGLLVIGGNSGDYTAVNLRAGTVMVLGTCGKNAGLGMRRGSLVIGELQGPLLAGFSPAGPADIEWLRLYRKKLSEWGMPLPKGWLESNWQRFSGDRLSLGKGEVLVHERIQ
ncbi:MAG TPA: formylmethanofuran dehydrogenase subunit C [Longilinea sp.]|nr:formylmethanofuran dehydrogenase subunit C [Longilinea sp.]